MKTTLKALSLLLAALMLLCVCACEESGSSLDKILKKQQIVFGCEPESLPMCFLSLEGEDTTGGTSLSGFCIDVGETVANSLDIEAVYVPVEPENALEALNNGEIDCYLFLPCPDIKTAAQMRSIDTGYDYRQLLAVCSDSDMDSLLDIKGHSVAVVSGSDAQKSFDAASMMSSSCSSVVGCGSLIELLEAVKSGAVDAGVVDEPVYLYSTRESEDFKTLSESVSESDYIIAFRLRDEELAERLEEIYLAMKDDGLLDSIKVEWWGE